MNKKQIQELPRNIKLGNKKIAIYGIGFVGTAIASTWLRAGASIIAVDKKNTLVNNINNKKITNIYFKFYKTNIFIRSIVYIVFILYINKLVFHFCIFSLEMLYF